MDGLRLEMAGQGDLEYSESSAAGDQRPNQGLQGLLEYAQIAARRAWVVKAVDRARKVLHTHRTKFRYVNC